MKLTLALVILNILAFALSLTNPEYYISNFGFSVDSFLSGNYHTIITAMFLHDGLLHLGGNMIALLFLGRRIEKETEGWQYMLIYFAAGIVGNLSMFIPIFGYSSSTIGIGASAAISGIIGSGIFVCPGKIVLFPLYFPLPFAAAGAVYFLATLSNLFVPGYVAYSSHLFGFLAGAAFGFSWSEDRIKRLTIFIALLLLIIFLPIILPTILDFLFSL